MTDDERPDSERKLRTDLDRALVALTKAIRCCSETGANNLAKTDPRWVDFDEARRTWRAFLAEDDRYTRVDRPVSVPPPKPFLWPAFMLIVIVDAAAIVWLLFR